MEPERDPVTYPAVAAAVAQVLTNLGDHDAAITMLKELLDVPSFLSTAYLRVHPEFDALRTHPRVQALLERR